MFRRLATAAAILLLAAPALARDDGRYADRSRSAANWCSSGNILRRSASAQNLRQCPAVMKPIKGGPFRNAVFSGQIEQVPGPSFVFDFDAARSIFGLLGSGRPSTVNRIIGSVVVNPVELQAGAVAAAHVGEEVRKYFPSLADSDSAATISQPFGIFWVGASGNHGGPNGDEWMSRVARQTQEVSGLFHDPILLLARDSGQWKDGALHSWFDKLASAKGLCCSFADGLKVEDVDWDVQGGKYRVRLNGQWITVPDAALVTEPNKFGPAVVWPYQDASGTTQIRCFIAGAGS